MAGGHSRGACRSAGIRALGTRDPGWNGSARACQRHVAPTTITTIVSSSAPLIRLDPELLAALQAVQERDGTPILEQVRRAIHIWLDTVGMSLKRTAVPARLMSEE